MKVLYNFSPEVKKLTLCGTNIKKLLPQAQKNILIETADIIMTEADKRVHVITGRTKASGEQSIPSLTQITITYHFGGVWEERRGGSHAFLAMATKKGHQQMAKIAEKYITDVVDAGMKGKPPRKQNYISKHRSATTGKWVYEYADTGRASRTSGRSRGGGRG